MTIREGIEKEGMAGEIKGEVGMNKRESLLSTRDNSDYASFLCLFVGNKTFINICESFESLISCQRI